MIDNIHIINSRVTILEALARLNALSGEVMTLIVTDSDMRVGGTVTDGDIRRALLRGARLDDEVSAAMHRGFEYIGPDSDPVPMLRRCRARGIVLLPRIDSDGRIVDIIDLRRTPTLLPLSAILMAGGKGERLRPLTLSRPKPLLEIDGRAIIDYNVEALARCGITDITVTTGYLAEQLREHFSEPVAGVTVRCVHEEKPLGTFGAVALVGHEASGATLVMNSDLLTSISFEDMYVHHISHGADITVATVPYTVSIPFAILETEGQCVTGLTEKPVRTYHANAGIYIIDNRLLSAVTPGVRIDAPDFIAGAIGRGCKVAYFPISGTWIDIGSPADFARAEEMMAHHRHLSR